MAYTEKNMQARFTKWMKKQNKKGKFTESMAFELKCLKKPRIGLRDFQDHQLAALIQAKHGAVYQKISDADRRRKPFDAFLIACGHAYVVIEFYKKNANHRMYWVDIDLFLRMLSKAKRDGRKSIKQKTITNNSNIKSYEF